MATAPAPPLTHTTGVVLAGGASARMGASKAALPIGGEPLLRRVVGRLRAAFAAVLVAGPPDLEALVPGVAVIGDWRHDQGPLAGLETTLATVATPRAFVVACDMPFVSPALARHMAELAARSRDADAVVLRTARGPEPLHAVFAVSCLPTVREQLDGGQRSMRRLLGRLRVREVAEAEARGFDPRGLSALNANTPEEWAHALRLVASGDWPADLTAP